MKSGSLRHPWLSLTDTLQNGDLFTEMVFGELGKSRVLLTSEELFTRNKNHNTNKHQVCLNKR